MGYSSWRARISASWLCQHPDRVRSLVIRRLGIGMITGVGEWDSDRRRRCLHLLWRTLRTSGAGRSAPSQIRRKAIVRALRCISTSRDLLTADEVGRIDVPVLIRCRDEG